MTITIVQGDITQQTTDAIVNAANTSLLAGGGVCGAIHRASGRELEEACLELAPCPTGSAVITPGFRLPARYVIHAVGPRWLDGTRGEAELLERCYRSIFTLMREHGIRSIAIPAISTGIYRFPLEHATEIALRTAHEFDNEEVEIVFVCFDKGTREAYARRRVDFCHENVTY